MLLQIAECRRRERSNRDGKWSGKRRTQPTMPQTSRRRGSSCEGLYLPPEVVVVNTGIASVSVAIAIRAARPAPDPSTRTSLTVSESPYQQAYADHAVADDHGRGVDGIARQRGHIVAARDHHDRISDASMTVTASARTEGYRNGSPTRCAITSARCTAAMTVPRTMRHRATPALGQCPKHLQAIDSKRQCRHEPCRKGDWSVPFMKNRWTDPSVSGSSVSNQRQRDRERLRRPTHWTWCFSDIWPSATQQGRASVASSLRLCGSTRSTTLTGTCWRARLLVDC